MSQHADIKNALERFEKDLFDVLEVEEYPCVRNGIRYSVDGNMICAVKDDDFINLQESPAGFGNTETEACANLVLSCVDHFQDWLKGRPNDLDYQRKVVAGSNNKQEDTYE